MADTPTHPVPAEPLAGRYQLLAWLGSGAAGTVYRAEDIRVQRTVAVKVVPEGSPGMRRVERECRVLRALDVPGVVRLLDDGQDGPLRFFVTDFVDGAAFPGAFGRGGWAALAPVAQALLRTIADVHAAGVVHRDLKPANVLVDDDGRPWLLDFGLARFLDAANPHSAEGIGTPRYLAPEQIVGEGSIDARADLYALGVMLYEVLAGRAPTPARSRGHLYVARLCRDVPPLASVAPGVPAAVATTIDQMLARSPEDRPGSAVEVLDRLTGAGVPGGTGGLPWLGAAEPLLRAYVDARRREPVTVYGLAGGGRSRAIDEVAARLRAEGVGVVRLEAGERPYASLAAGLGLEPGPELAAALDREERVLVVDDPEAIDPWSAGLLEGRPNTVRVVHTRPATVELELLSMSALQALFHGPRSVTERAAALMHQRTGGLPARVLVEVGYWMVEGVATRRGDRLLVQSELLSGIELGPPPDLRAGRRTRAPDNELLAWIALAEPVATTELLMRVTERQAWEIETELAALVSAGLVVREDDQLRLRPDLRVVDHGSAAERRVAAARLADALPLGSAGRFPLLLAAAAPDPVRNEAAHLAEIALSAGRSAEALAVCRWSARIALDAERGLSSEETARLARAALEVGSPAALQVAQALLRRAGAVDEPVGHSLVVGLVQAARERAAGLPFWASQALVGPDDPGRADFAALEEVRRVLTFEEELVADPAAATRRLDREQDPGRRLRWEAHLRLRSGNMEAAAALYTRALRHPASPACAARLRLGLAEAWLGMGSLREAAVLASVEEEHAWRQGRLETALHAAALRRAVSLREGAEPVDEALVDAATAIGLRPWTARILLGEAGAAWRVSALDEAAQLARRAAGASPRGSAVWILARTLELACHAGAVPEVCLELVTAADVNALPLGLQVRALACLACPSLGRQLLPQAEELARMPARLPFELQLLPAEDAVAFCRAAARRRPAPTWPPK